MRLVSTIWPADIKQLSFSTKLSKAHDTTQVGIFYILCIILYNYFITAFVIVQYIIQVKYLSDFCFVKSDEMSFSNINYAFQ